MKPETFLELTEKGEELIPTDKDYKVYISGMKKFYWYHLSKEQMETFIKLLNEKKVKIGFPGYFYARPYFISFGKPSA